MQSQSSTVFYILFSLSAFMVIVHSKDVCDGNDFGSPGDYDFLVFSQSWSATFCASHSSYPGCQHPTDFMRLNLTIHGLWSNYETERDHHSYPQCCQGEKYSISQATIDKYTTELDRFWPSEQGSLPISSTIWYNELQKHGACTIFDESAFVEFVLNMAQSYPILQTPNVISNHVGGSILLSDLQNVYGEYDTFFDCGTDGQTLTEIRTCWDDNPELKQINCPPIVMKETGACSSQIIIIPEFSKSLSVIGI